VVAAYNWGKWTRNEEASAIERRIDKDIRDKYEELVTYINLARRVTSQDAAAFIDEWLEKKRKKEGLDGE